MAYLRTVTHAPPRHHWGNWKMAIIRNPTRKTVTVTNRIAIHAEESRARALALGLFNAWLIGNGSPRLVVCMLASHRLAGKRVDPTCTPSEHACTKQRSE